MSVNAVSWAIDRAPVPGARCVARMILVHLADKADSEGRDTWKYVSAIADAIGVDDSTVSRNLAWLEEHGLIERGDQRLVDDYPEYARPVVWNLRLDRVREPSDRETKKRRAGRPRKRVEKPTRDSRPGFRDVAAEAGNPGGDLQPGICEGENPGAPVQPGWVRGCDQGGCTGALQNIHTHPETYNPSAPTGHLPAGGGASLGEGSDGVDRVLDGLARHRRGLGLSVREPSRADRKAVDRLLERLRGQGSPDPAGAVLAVLDTAYSGDWWPRLIRDGRSLASRWDRLSDDVVIAARSDAGPTGSRVGDSDRTGAHAHTASCGHVLDLVDHPEARAVEPDLAHRHEACERVAAWLGEGCESGEALDRLKDLLAESRRRREDAARRLAEARRVNGGRMFVGARGTADGGDAS